MHQHRTRAELFAEGLTSRDITRAVQSGELIRARRDRYLPGDTPDAVVRAVRVGGRLTCLSLLQLLEVFVLANSLLHVHLSPNATRLRTPHNRAKRLRPARSPKTRLHWRELPESAGSAACVDIVVALAHAVRCQTPRAAVASIDSALNKGVLHADSLSALFDLLPDKYRVLRRLVDGRAQSGPETLVRLMVHGLGCGFDLQVPIDGVGLVDLVVDGWLVIECDSKAFHSDWTQQLKDYRRDLELAKQGYCVLRLTAEDILYQPESVLASLRGVLIGRR